MRNLTILCLVLAVFVPATVRAHGPDTIGLWFDPDSTINVMDVPIATPFAAYLVLHEPSHDVIAGLEFRLEISDPTLLVLDAAWSGDPEVLEGFDCTLAGYGTPLPAEPATLLVGYTLMAVTNGEVLFRILACPEATCAFYVPPGLVPITCLTTVLADGLAARLDGAVGVEAASWSAVKGLYR